MHLNYSLGIVQEYSEVPEIILGCKLGDQLSEFLVGPFSLLDLIFPVYDVRGLLFSTKTILLSFKIKKGKSRRDTDFRQS